LRDNRYGRRRMSGELSGQVAIVTGGASGIGAASAALLAGQGARVIVADLQDARDGAGRFVSHDVASEESWKSLLADVLESEGRLDIVVNNAGISGVSRMRRPLPSSSGSMCRRSIRKACSWAANTPSRA
jgi:NAD(P)-dependent dehydrogenase (short-subunit alcohol dehydrogenase family)